VVAPQVDLCIAKAGVRRFGRPALCTTTARECPVALFLQRLQFVRASRPGAAETVGQHFIPLRPNRAETGCVRIQFVVQIADGVDCLGRLRRSAPALNQFGFDARARLLISGRLCTRNSATSPWNRGLEPDPGPPIRNAATAGSEETESIPWFFLPPSRADERRHRRVPK